MVTTGEGVARDPVEAVKWYRKAADQGHTYAQFSVTLSYFHGFGAAKDNGVSKDQVEAVKALALKGDPVAQFNLGNSYRFDHFTGEGVARNPVEAVKWYRKAADQGNADAQSTLGNCHDQGWGVAKDMVEAAKWWRKAADQGVAQAQYNLGIYYANGRGVARDPVEAVKWHRRAAEQWNAKALTELGLCYANGRGVAKDEVEAYAYSNLAGMTSESARQTREFFLDEKLSPATVLRGEQRTKEIQKAIQAKQAGK